MAALVLAACGGNDTGGGDPNSASSSVAPGGGSNSGDHSGHDMGTSNNTDSGSGPGAGNCPEGLADTLLLSSPGVAIDASAFPLDFLRPELEQASPCIIQGTLGTSDGHVMSNEYLVFTGAPVTLESIIASLPGGQSDTGWHVAEGQAGTTVAAPGTDPGFIVYTADQWMMQAGSRYEPFAAQFPLIIQLSIDAPHS
jgi:hypothetical protein